jgi:hypothetical protein
MKMFLNRLNDMKLFFGKFGKRQAPQQKSIFTIPLSVGVFTHRNWKFSTVATIVAIMLFATTKVSAQVYPINSSVVIIPPTPNSFVDFTAPGSEKIRCVLVLNDLTQPTYQVRLRLKVEYNGRLVMYTNPVYVPQNIITLTAGQPEVLTGADLSEVFNPNNLIFQNGFNSNQFALNATLPEGAYKICIAAYDYNRPDLQLSNEGCNLTFIQKREPPQINMPACGSYVRPLEPQFINFSWSSRNPVIENGTYNEKYFFELFLVEPATANIDYIVRSSNPLFSTAIENGTNFIYGPAEPVLQTGKTYAWRVRAQDETGATNAYKNNGYSNTCSFVYGGVNVFEDKGIEKPIIYGKALSDKSVRFRWNLKNLPADVAVQQWKLRVRRAGGGNYPWHDFETIDSFYNVSNLLPNMGYEAQVAAQISNIYGDYSNAIVIKTNEKKVYDCNPPNKDTTGYGAPLLQNLMPGDIVQVNHFEMQILEATGSNGFFSGKGKMTIPAWMIAAQIGTQTIDNKEGQNMGGLGVKFDNITINQNYRMTSGTVYGISQSISDWKKVQASYFAGGRGTGDEVTGDAPADILCELDIISEANIVWDATIGVIKITNANGDVVKEYKIPTADGKELPITIEDKDGDIYKIDKDGKVTKIGKRLPCFADVKKLLQTIWLTKGEAKFEDVAGSKYAFDAYNDKYTNATALYKDEYEAMETNDAGVKYYVPQKAIVPNATDKVKVTLTLKDNELKADSLYVVTGAGILLHKPTLLKRSGNVYTYELELTGGPADDAQGIFVVIKKDAANQYPLGKLKLVSYTPQERKVILVKVGTVNIDKEKIQEALKNTYGKLGITYTVEVEEGFATNKEWDTDNDGTIKDTRTGTFNNKFTGEQEDIIDVFTTWAKNQNGKSSFDKKASYIFYNNGASNNANLLGEMPRDKDGQFGFVFAGTAAQGLINKTIAHELGHGVFTLEHAFDAKVGLPNEGENLMDYSTTGIKLFKYQWDVVAKPGVVWGVFEGDDRDNFINQTSSSVLSFKNSKNYNIPNTGECNYFITPIGWVICLPKNINDVAFENGFITGFKVDGKEYSFSSTKTPEDLPQENGKIIDGIRVTQSIGKTTGVHFIDWVSVKKQEEAEKNKPENERKIKKSYRLDVDGEVVSVYISKYIKNYTKEVTNITSCTSGLKVVEKFDANKKAILRQLTAEECKRLNSPSKSIYESGDPTYGLACPSDLYSLENLFIQTADGSKTLGDKMVINIKKLIQKNSVNKEGDNVFNAKINDLEYIHAGTNYRNNDVFKAGVTFEELNNKLGYLEITTGYQFYSYFMERFCANTVAEVETLAKRVFDNSNISKTKGILCVIIENYRAEATDPNRFVIAVICGTGVKEAATIKQLIIGTKGDVARTYKETIIKVYKEIPKKKAVIKYFIKAASNEEVAAWRTKAGCDCNGGVRPCPSYAPLTKDIFINDKQVSDSPAPGNAIEAEYYIIAANNNNVTPINNENLELKEWYVQEEGVKIAKIYGGQFGNWQLESSSGSCAWAKDSYYKDITSTKPHVSACHYTLKKPCSMELIDNIILGAQLASAFLPTAWPTIIVSGVAVIYYGATGQPDEMNEQFIFLAIPPALSVVFKSVGAVVKVSARLIKFTKAGIAACTRDIRFATNFNKIINQGITKEGAELLFNKAIDQKCVEYLLPHPRGGSQWVKATESEAMIGTFEFVNNDVQLVIKGYAKEGVFDANLFTEAKVLDLIAAVTEKTYLAKYPKFRALLTQCQRKVSSQEFNIFVNRVSNGLMEGNVNGKLITQLESETEPLVSKFIRASERDEKLLGYTEEQFKKWKALNGAGNVALDVATATEKQLDDIFSGLQNSPPFKYAPNTLEHKAERWAQYKVKLGSDAKDYSNWSNIYNSNMTKATKAHQAADEVMATIGWGQREVTVQAGTYTRRMDIADKVARKGVEVKSYETGKVYATDAIKGELNADKYLIDNDFWQIEWVFKGCEPSQPLRTLLEQGGITIKLVP